MRIIFGTDRIKGKNKDKNNLMKNFILLKQSKQGTHSYDLSERGLRNKIIALAGISCAILFSFGLALGYLMFHNAQQPISTDIQDIQAEIAIKENQLNEFKSHVNRELDAMSLQVGGLYAQSLRLNALGARVSEVAKLEQSEFDFSTEPGIGGAALTLTGQENTPEDLFNRLYSIKSSFEQQEKQLLLLNELLDEKNLSEQIKPSGKPIKNGWMSSRYGSRIDPFTGKQAFHSGLDFSGKPNSEIQSIADGVIIWAGKRGNYGNLVEIDHGSGYITRYAHLSQIDVEVGDKVTKGETLGLMGKTGRATSEHLHFEILKNGKKLNPWSYVTKK